MTTTIRHAALAALAAATLVGAAGWGPAAWAQQSDRSGPPADMRARFQAMREARETQHAQDLRTILRLRPDQEGALTAFLQSRKRPEGPQPGGRRGPPGAAPQSTPMTTPQRLDEMARREAERADRQRRHAESLRTFYAALSPDQRQVFDALQRTEGAGRGGWGHRGFGGGRMGGRMGGPGGPGGPEAPPLRGD